MCFRHVLASLHFNENVKREVQTDKNGNPYFKVSYPKFKQGEEVVREVSIAPTYGRYNSREGNKFVPYIIMYILYVC